MEKFTLSDEVNKTPFPNHSVWLENVLKELNRPGGTRVAFGAFLQTEEYESSLLIGCIFVKRPIVGDIVEMKSLLIYKKEWFRQTLNLEVGLEDISYSIRELKKSLIEKAIRFCEQREFPGIEMELLQDDMRDEIHILMDYGFKISYIKEKYDIGKFVCILSKKLGAIYRSDPFDYLKVIRWFIRSLIPCTIKEIEHRSNDEGQQFDYASFFRPPYSSTNDKRINSNFFDIHGEVVLIESDFDYSDLEVIGRLYQKDKNNNLRYLIAEKSSAQLESYCSEVGIKFVSFEKLLEFAGGKDSSFAIPFGQKDIAGIVTVLDQSEITLLSQHEFISYFLVSGIGSHIQISAEREEKLILAIYCHQFNDGYNHHKGLVGYAYIENSDYVDYDRAYGCFEGSHKALKEEDLIYYEKISYDGVELGRANESKYNKKPKVKVLLLSGIQGLKKPWNFPSVGLNEDTRVRYNYFRNELTHNMSSAVYLDHQTKDAILKLETQPIVKRTFPQQSPKLKVERKIFISYSSLDEDLIGTSFWVSRLKEEFTEVYIDFERKLMGDSLNDIIPFDVEYAIIFISNNAIRSSWCGYELWCLLKRNIKLVPFCLDKELYNQIINDIDRFLLAYGKECDELILKEESNLSEEMVSSGFDKGTKNKAKRLRLMKAAFEKYLSSLGRNEIYVPCLNIGNRNEQINEAIEKITNFNEERVV
ncbi:MAG: toll/interleukin-1 receptor domain-containing protein [Flavobacteriales bacterium]